MTSRCASDAAIVAIASCSQALGSSMPPASCIGPLRQKASFRANGQDTFQCPGACASDAAQASPPVAGPVTCAARGAWQQPRKKLYRPRFSLDTGAGVSPGFQPGWPVRPPTDPGQCPAHRCASLAGSGMTLFCSRYTLATRRVGFFCLHASLRNRTPDLSGPGARSSRVKPDAFRPGRGLRRLDAGLGEGQARGFLLCAQGSGARARVFRARRRARRTWRSGLFRLPNPSGPCAGGCGGGKAGRYGGTGAAARGRLAAAAVAPGLSEPTCQGFLTRRRESLQWRRGAGSASVSCRPAGPVSLPRSAR